MPRLANRIAALRRFARAREGATAVEFAVIAIPMLMMIFGMIELGLVLLVSTTLDTATDFATRNIRTGVFQQGADKSALAFKQKVCANMTWLSGACSGLKVEAETFDDFSDANAAPAPDFNTYDPTKPPRCWKVGNDGSIVLVRVYYKWKVFTPLLNKYLANSGADSRVITSSAVFRNEPYSGEDTEAAGCN